MSKNALAVPAFMGAGGKFSGVAGSWLCWNPTFYIEKFFVIPSVKAHSILPANHALAVTGKDNSNLEH